MPPALRKRRAIRALRRAKEKKDDSTGGKPEDKKDDEKKDPPAESKPEDKKDEEVADGSTIELNKSRTYKWALEYGSAQKYTSRWNR